MAEAAVDSGVLELLGRLDFGMLKAWPDRGSDSGACRMGIRSLDCERERACAAYSAIRAFGSFGLIGAQKNGVRLLRARAEGLVRPARTAGTRPVERRVSDCAGTGGAAR